MFKPGDKEKIYSASTSGLVTIYDVTRQTEEDAFIDGTQLTHLFQNYQKMDYLIQFLLLKLIQSF